MIPYDLNERLLTAVHSRNFDETISCLVQGASATHISLACGRTAVGTAAFVGDAEILDMLIQFCEEPELDVFRQARNNSSEVDTTPDGMDKLEWEDEFNEDSSSNQHLASTNATTNSSSEPEVNSLYHYYAKMIELTGELIASATISTGIFQKPKTQDAHTVDAHLMSPLHYAAQHGQIACLRKLLEHGAPVDVFNSRGYTPLHLGIRNADVVCLLIKYGANPNMKTINGGYTALQLAIRHHSVAVAELILQTNVDINQTDDKDQTPLILAAANGMDEIVHSLVQRGARINIQDSEGFTALYFAVKRNKLSLVKLLLSKGARRIPSHYLLHYCVIRDRGHMVEELVAHGDCINVRNRDNYTPIMLAISHQHTNILEFLLKVAEGYRFSGYREPMDTELLESVQLLNDVSAFQPIARILFTHSERSRRELYNLRRHPLLCNVSYCQTPLSRAICTQKLDIAAFLLMEGTSIRQLCRDHVVNTLRAMSSPQSMIFASLLIHMGFRFPCKRSRSLPANWSPERVMFEQHIQRLMHTPLPLQSLARDVIRRRVLHMLQSSPAYQSELLPTDKQSAFEILIEDLFEEVSVPRLLKTYLVYFDDVPSLIFEH